MFVAFVVCAVAAAVEVNCGGGGLFLVVVLAFVCVAAEMTTAAAAVDRSTARSWEDVALIPYHR